MSTTRLPPLRLAVVGHTNTGKTSLLRTLTRDTGFGEVSPRPGTTRHVEGARLLADGEAVIELFDTPGMEDAVALLEAVEATVRPGERVDGPERIARFLAAVDAGASAAGRTAGQAEPPPAQTHAAGSGPQATTPPPDVPDDAAGLHDRFEQEAKVLRQVLASDAALYVADVRDPVLAKHRDELAALAWCGRPLLPVLNFVSAPESREEDWRVALGRLGLHAVVSFDTVAPAVDGERRLLEKLATLLDAYRPALERLLAARSRDAAARRAAAARLVAELLVDVAACRRSVAADADLAAAIAALRAEVRRREQDCVAALLALYRFRPDDVQSAELPLLDGRWEEDLFSPEILRAAGIKAGMGAAAGAAAGLGVDLAVGGVTLGAAAALGALAGGLWQAVGEYGGRLKGKLLGYRSLTVDDAVLRLLALRQRRLLAALEGRGHAATAPVVMADEDARRWRSGALPEALRRARAHPEWSTLGPGRRVDAAREAAVATLAEEILAGSASSGSLA